MAPDAKRRTLDDLLADAEGRIARLAPAEAHQAMRDGALLIDIRSDRERMRDGIVPGSVHIPRTVLEWRLDPAGAWRNPHTGNLDEQIILLCDHGCATILAAATLVDMGYARAGDVVGGFAAWRGAGLPTAATPPLRWEGELPGMQGPDR